mmetsp:Transcript_72021/g.120796  ORF Transcript_72021/g.120796 Transcript_72021/m.120796 type:complete len:99 (-) Transcript_72021:1224-1520(-)
MPWPQKTTNAPHDLVHWLGVLHMYTPIVCFTYGFATTQSLPIVQRSIALLFCCPDSMQIFWWTCKQPNLPYAPLQCSDIPFDVRLHLGFWCLGEMDPA